MGDLHDRALHQNYLLGSEPNPSEVPAESCRVAEEEIRRIIGRIQPTKASEGRRGDVVEYVQRLITRNLGLEVFSYGSVPLKTYLPDGDIDFTAFGAPNMEDKLVGDVRTLFELEENNKDAEFEVKDVQFINAEVKLVKCLVQNIVIDISFNQIGGLCTLYFLEKVNMTIGNDNLFKRSIILIKAWCYYESRILGAHHALISTYALETLVLYIFQFFHSSLDGPLAVLYKFLDYFSKFDWDNYCISLQGPVRVSSLPQIIAGVPQTDGGEPLLSKGVLNECGNLLPFFQRTTEIDYRVFPRKHLNIVDPLKENNNLGRSVSKGNFHRIRSAFAYGARKLGRILLLPKESVRNDLNKFFTNTLERHENGDRPDLRGTRPGFVGRSPFDLSDVSNAFTDVTAGNISKDDAKVVSLASDGSLGNSSEKVADSKISGSGNTHGPQKECSIPDRINVPYAQVRENINNMVNRKTSGSRIIDNNHSHVRPEMNKNWYPHPSSSFCEENGWIADGEYHHGYRSRQMESDMENTTSGNANSGISMSSNGSDLGDDNTCDVGHSSIDLHSSNANGLADLSGDLVVHYENLLLYAQCSVGGFAGRSSSHFQGSNEWDYSIPPHLSGIFPISAFPSDHNFQKATRGGTGTYFPNMRQNYPQSRGRPERGRNPYPNRHHNYRSNGHPGVSQASRSEDAERGGHDPDVSRRIVTVANDDGRSTPESFETPSTAPSTQSSGAAPRHFQIAFGSFSPVSLGAAHLKSTDANAPLGPSSSPMCSPVVQKPASPIQESKSAHVYKLKDEGDFPPLAGRGSPTSPAPANRHKTVWEAKGGSGFS